MEPNMHSAQLPDPDNSIRARNYFMGVSVALIAGAALVLASLPFQISLLTLIGGNVIGFIVLAAYRQKIATRISALTILLLLFTLFFTNWGFSMPEPRMQIAWMYFIPACVFQLSLILLPFWLHKVFAPK